MSIIEPFRKDYALLSYRICCSRVFQSIKDTQLRLVLKERILFLASGALSIAARHPGFWTNLSLRLFY